MAVFTKEILSGSADGRPIKAVAIATPGTLIHTATAAANEKDEIYLYANNTSGGTILLTVEFGGTTTPDDLIEVGLAAESGLILIVPGLVLQNGLSIRAFAASANVINITGYVNRIAP